MKMFIFPSAVSNHPQKWLVEWSIQERGRARTSPKSEIWRSHTSPYPSPSITWGKSWDAGTKIRGQDEQCRGVSFPSPFHL